MRKRLPTFCTWKIYTAPTRADGRHKDEEEIKKGEIFRDESFQSVDRRHAEADFCRREQFEECEMAPLWRWLTQGDEFTGDLLATWVNRDFPMVPLGWHQWQEASWVKEMVLKSYLRELFHLYSFTPVTPVEHFQFGKIMIKFSRHHSFPQQACGRGATITIRDYFRSRGQRSRWQRSE